MMVGVGSSDQPATTAMAGNELEVVSGAIRAVARPGQPVTIGRSVTCQVVLDDPLVSRRHAEVSFLDGSWVLRDLESSNGTFVNGERSGLVRLADGVEVRLGDAANGPSVRFALAEPVPAPPVAATPAGVGRARAGEYAATSRVRIGRTPDNDIVLGDVLVSRRHAEVRRMPDGYHVVDLGSRNGIFHNGRQVQRAKLQPGDRVAIGRHQLMFDGERLHEYVDRGPVSLSADDLTVKVGKQTLLTDVSFGLAEGNLLAVIGPSGCGKSTLVRAVTGIRPATSGKVHYDGRDLYANYGELRYRIGLVPQDDVLHRQLTVRRALRFAAALRFADDVPRRERKAKVDEVLGTLGLSDRARQRIDTLSGGQRKRTSVALELLTEPSLLCLDEPTSGLDPALDREVMEELRELADRGRTVVVVTHNVLHLDMCDRVMVMCPGGTLGYFGPPGELLDFFAARDYADVFAMVTEDPRRWSERYRSSDLFERYARERAEPLAAPVPAQAPAPLAESVEAPEPAAGPEVAAASAVAAGSADEPATGATTVEPEAVDDPGVPLLQSAGPLGPPVIESPLDAPAPAAQPGVGASGAARVLPKGIPGLPLRSRALHPAAPVRQFVTLCVRMLAVIIADKGYALFLLGLPLALALLTHSVPGDTGLAPPTQGFSLEAQRMLVVLVVGAAFLGIAPAIREIVGEATIYRRERACGLSPGAYLASKLVVFAIINTIQVALFVWLSLLGRGGPKEALVLGSPMAEIVFAVALTALTCTMLGLCISALARTPEQTTPVLVVVVMAQLVLCGGLFELGGEAVLQQVSWLASTRWGLAAGASTVDLLSMSPVTDALWQHTAGAWWRSIALLVVHGAVWTGLARLALLRLEPGRQ